MGGDFLVAGGGFEAFWWSLGRAMSETPTANRVYAYSSGSLVAAIALCEIDPKEVLQAALETQQEGHFFLHRIVQTFLRIVLPMDAHIKTTKLRIIVSRPAQLFAGEVHSGWSTRTDLINSVLASCFIPFVSLPIPVDPVHFSVDGGIAWGLPYLMDMQRISYTGPCVLTPISSTSAMAKLEEGLLSGDAVRATE